MSGDRIGDRYHNETKYTRESLGGGGLNWSGRSEPFKTYPEAIARLKLANPELDRRDNLWHALAERRSRRDYARGSLSFQALSQLVWACQGVTGKVSGYLLRTAPSAGALYPIETYLVVNNVDGLNRGVYHLNMLEWELELVREQDMRNELANAALGQSMCAEAAAVFVWTAIPARSKWKYRERAYRYIYMDAGHICQNLYLACEAMGLACCGIGAFFDDEVNQVIGVNGKDETAVYMASVGIII
jgi:SagB-type dehydrogenase family enzyme